MFWQLLETLHLLASPPEVALAWLERESKRIGGGVVLSVDEIALDFENWAEASWQLVESGQLNEATHATILALDDLIGEIGNHPADWTPAAFTASAKWTRVRTAAAAVLQQIESIPQRS